MLTAVHGAGGMVSAPHGAASEAGLAILRRGGTAVEAAVATAAALAVVYPHMNSIGGDSFWLIHAPGAPPLGVDASGRAGSKAHVDLYRATGLSEIPTRGPLAANTVAGAVSGWARALELSADWRTPTPLEALLEPA